MKLNEFKKFGVMFCRNPTLRQVEDETHTPKSGNLESSGTLVTSELNCRGQNTSPWNVFYSVGKALKCRCQKCPCMSQSNIYSTSYGRKKGRPDPGVCRCSATHSWKALEESYKFASDLNPIRGLSRLGVMSSQSLGSSNRDNFGTPPWESRE